MRRLAFMSYAQIVCLGEGGGGGRGDGGRRKRGKGVWGRGVDIRIHD